MSQDKEREAFEAWYFDKNMKPPIRHHLREDEYEFTHARDAWEGWQARAALASQQAGKGEPARPDILERLSYHALERDDLTLDECLDYLAKGWAKVHGRTERQMVMQILALLAGQSASPPSREPLTEWEARGMLARLKCWHRLTEQEADELVQFAMQGGIHMREPLTDEQIEDCIDDANRLFNHRRSGPHGQQMSTYDDWKYWLVRTIERAHGIHSRGEGVKA